MSNPLTLTLLLSLGLLAQSKDDDSAARLTFMKGSVTPYNVHPLAVGSSSFQLQPDPVFRLANPVTGINDGAIFLWVNDLGRPEAAVQVFRIPNGVWLHEFTSLSTAPFVAEVNGVASWKPARAGLEYKAVPDAPKPATTPEARLRQMRAISLDFSAEDQFQGKIQGKGWQTLRLLPKPWLRYGKAGAGAEVEDGALFAFVLGTDPEVFLMLEARPGKAGLEWQYAFAPMTSYEVKAAWKGREVWTQPWRENAKSRDEIFFDMDYSREK